jgi:hypothetical protein
MDTRMMKWIFGVAIGALMIGAASAPTQPSTTKVAAAGGTVSYTNQIAPILESRCESCHSGDDAKGDFDTTSVANLLKKGKKSGLGVVAGKPGESSVVKYIEGEKKPRMPKGKKPLTDEQIGLIKGWVAQGAVDDTGKVVAIVSKEKKEGDTSVAPTSAPVNPRVVSEDWDPNVPWSAAEAAAVRRYQRLKFLPPAPAVPSVDVVAFNEVDRFVAVRWGGAGDKSAKPQAASATTRVGVPDVCDDSTFVRRAFLDIVGFIPSAAEARKFVEDKAADKRVKLVDALLARDEQYAQNWAPFWEDALCSNGLHQGGVGTHGNYRKWLLESFKANKPYDLMVQELLDPKEPNHPARYVLNSDHARTVQSAADTAQVFLGTAIKCASCHNHFLNDEWPQARAVAFAGYFQQKDMEIVRCERGTGKFVETHFMFDLPKMPTSAPSTQSTRMKEVAQLITDPTNPRFAKTIVNRLWKRYMGLGLFEPADDFRADVPASHPELLEWLANDFVRNGYNLKHTIRLILTSRTYQLKYDPKLADKFDVEKPGAPRYFRSPALRRLTAEQLLDSVNVAVNQKELGDGRTFGNDSSTPLTRALGRPPTRNEVSTARPDDTAVVQSLELLNGQEYHDRVYKGSQVAAMSVTTQPSAIVEDMYWSAYGRGPTTRESEVGTKYLKSAPKPATTQPVDLVWVEDSVPPGATMQGLWVWAPKTAQPVFSGKLSHTDGQTTEPIATQHLFHGARFEVEPKDVLFTYVFIDPEAAPSEIMMQFHTGGDWKRVFWGADEIKFKPVTNLGALPAKGKWVKLEIPAAKVGIDKLSVIAGISFDQMPGTVYWDKTGVSKGAPSTDPETIGDMVWALLTSPEFQYIR